MKSMKVILSVRNLQILNLCLSVSVLLKYGSCCFGMAVVALARLPAHLYRRSSAGHQHV